MQTLTRQDLIEHLRTALATPDALRRLPRWAFDQFYAAEEEQITFEPGYRAPISAVLDDLMFGDAQAFALETADVERMIQRLEHDQPAFDDELNDDDDE